MPAAALLSWTERFYLQNGGSLVTVLRSATSDGRNNIFKCILALLFPFDIIKFQQTEWNFRKQILIASLFLSFGSFVGLEWRASNLIAFWSCIFIRLSVRFACLYFRFRLNSFFCSFSSWRMNLTYIFWIINHADCMNKTNKLYMNEKGMNRIV